MVWLENGERRSGIALGVVVTGALDLMLQKKSPGWPPIDFEISPRIIRGLARPWGAYAYKSVAKRDGLLLRGIEEAGEGKKDTGR